MLRGKKIIQKREAPRRKGNGGGGSNLDDFKTSNSREPILMGAAGDGARETSPTNQKNIFWNNVADSGMVGLCE